MDPVIGVITSTFGTYWWVWLLTAVIAYLIGSVNPAVIVTKIWTKGKKDMNCTRKQWWLLLSGCIC